MTVLSTLPGSRPQFTHPRRIEEVGRAQVKVNNPQGLGRNHWERVTSRPADERVGWVCSYSALVIECRCSILRWLGVWLSGWFCGWSFSVRSGCIRDNAVRVACNYEVTLKTLVSCFRCFLTRDRAKCPANVCRTLALQKQSWRPLVQIPPRIETWILMIIIQLKIKIYVMVLYQCNTSLFSVGY